ncbi:alpha-L-fucosidase-like [Ornithodoros turicata]|uniref:alpha-L-fucosidase-like n=1 Tax=Ornithodoros turicata TaxID=34597 RepID=UPI003139248A
MLRLTLALVVLLICDKPVTGASPFGTNIEYYARWDHLDTRPVPAWYDQAKVGILLYWGVFSVPSFGSEWLWYHWNGRQNSLFSEFMNAHYRPNFTYQAFAPEFTCEFYNPDRWVDIVQKSGAKYVIFTAKHFEGYTLWPSKRSWNWNSVDVGPRRDLLGEFAHAVKTTTGLKFGIYYSLYEWFNPLFLDDRENNFKTDAFVTTKVIPELYELVKKYEPEVVWADGDWEAPDSYWDSTRFLAWLYTNSTVKENVVTNDRWGKGLWCKHGDFRNCKDGHNPRVLQKRKFENVMNLDKPSWGYRRNAQLKDFISDHVLIKTLIETVSCGGNILITLGPTHDGRIPAIFEERLITLGKWLATVGEAIYGTRPWEFQNDTVTGDVWYTASGAADANGTPEVVYAFLLEWPASGLLRLGALTPGTTTEMTLLGNSLKLSWKVVGNRIVIVNLPPPPIAISTKVEAWVIKISKPAPRSNGQTKF